MPRFTAKLEAVIPEVATWLDLLPEKVCGSVAENVSSGRQTVHALHLALTSQKQTRAVWYALRQRVEIDLGTKSVRCSKVFPSDEETAGWIHAFREYPKSVTVYRSTQEAEDLLRTGNIYCARISAHQCDLIAALCESRSVRRLVLRISYLLDLCKVFKDIASLPLDELELREIDDSYYLDGGFDIPCFDNLVPFAMSSANCAKSFDHLKQFYWIPLSRLTEGTRSYWDAITLLPKFTSLFFATTPPEHLLSTLSQFRSIHVANCTPSEVACLGSALVSFRSYFLHHGNLLTAEEVIELASCPCLEQINLHVNESVQDVLAELVSRLPCLTTLHLSCRRRISNGWREPAVDLAPGLMLSIVTATPKLQFLSVTGGHVPLSEWEPIISHRGDKLKKLSLNYEVEKNEQCPLLLDILSLVPRFCKDMYDLTIRCHIQTLERLEYQQVVRVLHAARRAQRALPTLNQGKLEDHISSICDPLNMVDIRKHFR